MKKVILTLTIAIFTLFASAQTKALVKSTTPPIDTIRHLKPMEILERAMVMQNLTFALNRPDDISANQRKAILRSADSLVRLDATWFNNVKPQPVTPPTKH